MTWIFILFWAFVGAFCVYIIIDINQTKTNDEKISRIKDEMARVDKINELNARIDKTRQKNSQEWIELVKYTIHIYENAKTFIIETTTTICQFIIDIISPRLYGVIG
jgi:thiamine biosynthesis lipoprotein ApbE